MADTKVTALTALSTAAGTDILYIVDDPGGSPASKKITVDDLLVGMAPDASDITYTPGTATDWDSDTDPGDLDDALDQLAERVDDLEGATPEATRGIAFYVGEDQEVATRLAAIIVPLSLTITEVRALVGTAPVGADLIVDVNKNGTTIFTTQGNRPTIADGNTSDTSGTPDVTALAVGDVLSIDVDQIGSGTAGADLSVTVICEEA
jgi:hypothetical protein